MPRKVEFSSCPPPYKIERIGANSAKISLVENALEIKNENGAKWEADVYELVTAYTVNIEERIESNYDAWMKHAKDVDYEVEKPQTLEDRLAKVETLVSGTPSYGDLLETVNLLLEA